MLNIHRDEELSIQFVNLPLAVAPFDHQSKIVSSSSRLLVQVGEQVRGMGLRRVARGHPGKIIENV